MLANNGAKVVVNGRDEQALHKVVEQIHADGGHAVGVCVDAGSLEGLEELRNQTERAFGTADILGAFLAGGGPPPGPTSEISQADWNAAIDGNLTVTFLAIKTFLPGMLERRRGSIVTMASTAARHAAGERIGAPTGYAVAKAGVVRLTQEVAREVGPFGIRVNCVAPSTVLTERLDSLIPEERRAQMTAMHPLGRLGTPEDVASAVLFLASESASWITGITLDVAGGHVMR
jgi:3-oxoacyl-[acyl-carrier protein] reductase